jgi:hypothetical protein
MSSQTNVQQTSNKANCWDNRLNLSSAETAPSFDGSNRGHKQDVDQVTETRSRRLGYKYNDNHSASRTKKTTSNNSKTLILERYMKLNTD